MGCDVAESAVQQCRNTLLSLFGPLSILILMGLWAIGMILCFATLHWVLASPVRDTGESTGFLVYLYMSGVVFFTLGFGDVTPALAFGRFLAVVETGIGFAFLAVVISYLPILYQAFSNREVSISLLDARGFATDGRSAFTAVFAPSEPRDI